MKIHVLLAAGLAAVLLASGCVSKKNYEKLQSDYNTLNSDYKTLNADFNKSQVDLAESRAYA